MDESDIIIAKLIGILGVLFFAIADSIILGLYWDNPCDQPFRWLVLSRLISSLVIALYNTGDNKNSGVQCIFGIGQITWFVFLNIHFLNSDTCKSTNLHMYNLVMAYFIINYIVLGIIVVFGIIVVLANCCSPKVANQPTQAEMIDLINRINKIGVVPTNTEVV